MTEIAVGVVDAYVVDPDPAGWRVLLLRRGPATRCPGSWETVHGHIEPGERPEDAALREVREETGLVAERLYTITVQPFYLPRMGAVQMAVVFAVFVTGTPAVTVGPEHDGSAWLPIEGAMDRYTWPRSRTALGEIVSLLRGGDAGPAEDVLRVR